jgi:hypothetical protein
MRGFPIRPGKLYREYDLFLPDWLANDIVAAASNHFLPKAIVVTLGAQDYAS